MVVSNDILYRANGRGGFEAQNAAEPPATLGESLECRLWVL